MSPPAPNDPTRSLTLWQRIELLAMVATIPAFYMALLSTERWVVVSLYLLACGAAARVVWHDLAVARAAPAEPGGDHEAPVRVGLALAAGLLLSALVPAGDSLPALGVRLATAGLIVLRLGESLRPWFWRGSLPHLLGLALGVLGLCGLGFWWLEPKVHSFGDGLWLAFTTAATVGYGDIVPSTPAAKIFAVFVVLMGFAVLSLVTAAIAAMWVQSGERRIEHEILRDLHRQLRSVHGELAEIRREQALQRQPVPASRDQTGEPAQEVTENLR